MDLFRDVLDNQLLDSKQRKIGRVDGIVAQLREDKPPRIVYLEVGLPVLARRIHPRLAHWLFLVQRRWGKQYSESVQIPIEKVLDVGIDVDVDLDAKTTSLLVYEQWLREHIVKYILEGGGDDKP